MRWLVLAAALSLSGCAAAPAWLTIAAPALGYLASVNQLGAATLKFVDDKNSCQVQPSIQPVQIVTLETVQP